MIANSTFFFFFFTFAFGIKRPGRRDKQSYREAQKSALPSLTSPPVTVYVCSPIAANSLYLHFCNGNEAPRWEQTNAAADLTAGEGEGGGGGDQVSV